MAENENKSRCSFCNKPQDIEKLCFGPGVSICKECVALCCEAFAEDREIIDEEVVGSSSSVDSSEPENVYQVDLIRTADSGGWYCKAERIKPKSRIINDGPACVWSHITDDAEAMSAYKNEIKSLGGIEADF